MTTKVTDVTDDPPLAPKNRGETSGTGTGTGTGTETGTETETGTGIVTGTQGDGFHHEMTGTVKVPDLSAVTDVARSLDRIAVTEKGTCRGTTGAQAKTSEEAVEDPLLEELQKISKHFRRRQTPKCWPGVRNKLTTARDRPITAI